MTPSHLPAEEDRPSDAARPRARLGWAAIATVLFLTLWASSPLSPILSVGVDLLPGGDTTGHVLVMGMLAALCVLAFAGRNVRGWRLTPGRILALVALAVTADEFVQAVVPSRTFDWTDLAASLVGVVLFGGVAALVQTRRQSEVANENRAPEPETSAGRSKNERASR